MANKKKTALTQQKGVSLNETVNPNSKIHIKATRAKKPETERLIKGILDQNISYLSQAITLVESTNPLHKSEANTVLKACLPYANSSIRIGITGVPGVGKSTCIEALGKHLTQMGKRVAVLAVDPSSTISKGSILGDKTRMEALAKDKNAFIRPSASGNALGGVARTTRESIVLCEAAGYNVILIETVGVGQSETAVHSMVDFFLLLKLAGAGDELQGIKRGIVEMADAIAINKADADNKKAAQLAKTEFNRALHLYPPKASGWIPQVSLCSALHNKGIDALWLLICEYEALTKSNGYFYTKREEQNTFWLIQTIENQLKSNFFNQKHIETALKEQLKLVAQNKTTPFAAAELILGLNKSP